MFKKAMIPLLCCGSLCCMDHFTIKRALFSAVKYEKDIPESLEDQIVLVEGLIRIDQDERASKAGYPAPPSHELSRLLGVLYRRSGFTKRECIRRDVYHPQMK